MLALARFYLRVCLHAKWLQLCPTLCDSMDCSLPRSSVHGIPQARILEWATMPSSRGSSKPRDWNCCSCRSCIAGGFFTAEPLGKPYILPIFICIYIIFIFIYIYVYTFANIRWDSSFERCRPSTYKETCSGMSYHLSFQSVQSEYYRVSIYRTDEVLYINDSLIAHFREGNGTPLQYSCLENPMDGGVW